MTQDDSADLVGRPRILDGDTPIVGVDDHSHHADPAHLRADAMPKQ